MILFKINLMSPLNPASRAFLRGCLRTEASSCIAMRNLKSMLPTHIYKIANIKASYDLDHRTDEASFIEYFLRGDAVGIEDLKKVGVCIRNQGQSVLFQNDLAVRMCGNQIGGVCSKACLSLYGQMKECAPISQGMKLFKNTDFEGSKVDATIINDGERITTFFYPLEQVQNNSQQQEDYFVGRGLTKSEIKIMQMVLQGMINSDIADKLFISKATLKTHLNNAYKKLPASMRPSQLRIVNKAEASE